MPHQTTPPPSLASLLLFIVALVFVIGPHDSGVAAASDGTKWGKDKKAMSSAGNRYDRVKTDKFGSADASSQGSGGGDGLDARRMSYQQSRFGATNRWGNTGGGSDTDDWRKKS